VPEDRAYAHLPVLLEEVVSWLSPGLTGPATVIDCTLGGGGHSEALLERMPQVSVVGIDRDEDALTAASDRLGRFGERVKMIHSNYRRLSPAFEAADEPVKGVLYDLGVSSPQLDLAVRGFQYRGDAPLDMRMDRSESQTAAEIVNSYSNKDLARVLSVYGEERFASRIARAIVAERSRAPIRTAGQLAEIVKSAIPAPARRKGPHPARRTFQALRIEVNQELESLEESLPQAIGGLEPGGRLVAIAYHSLEDRIVKRSLADAAKGCRCPKDLPVCVCGRKAIARVLTRKPVRPSDEEVSRNRRADSARLRAAMKLENPGEAA
jgi:16S rRNA (cytosine1402-N4)-methyltransferase